MISRIRLAARAASAARGALGPLGAAAEAVAGPSGGCARAAARLPFAPFSRHFSAEIDLDKPQTRKVGSPKVEAIANSILELNMLEAHDLSEIMKERLGLAGVPMGMGFGGGGGGMAAAAPAAAPAAAAAAPAAAAVAEKLEFDVRLESYEAANKIKIIKEVRAATGLGLKEAKDLVESTPAVMKKGLKKEEAEALQKVLQEAGGKVTLA